jgi:hypothetical protein
MSRPSYFVAQARCRARRAVAGDAADQPCGEVVDTSNDHMFEYLVWSQS